MADLEGFGSPDSVRAIATAAQQAGGELERLTELVNTDVTTTVPDSWGGAAASAMDRHWLRFLMAIRGIGSPLDTYATWLEVAAKAMVRAKEELASAQQYADRNGLYIQPDLTVRAYVADRADAGARIVIAQSMVNRAKELADEARTHIRTANRMLEKHAAQSLLEMNEIIAAMAAAPGRGGRRPGVRRPPRARRVDEDDMLEWGVQGRIRLPRANAGEWVEGRPGHGVWAPHRPGDYGLLPGETIRWRDGVPDLREYRLPLDRMPGAVDPDLTGLRLTGRPADMAIGDAALARQFGPGWTPDSVRQWRTDNDLIFHHYSSSELQLVPGRIHRALPHQGGASEAR